MTLLNKMTTRKLIGCFVATLLVLSFGVTLPSSVMAQELDYTDITPRQAYWLIRRHSSSDIVILDVRNDSEYTFEHLYNSLQIQCYLLEHLIELYEANPNADIIDYRSVELMAHINDPIIVYCAKGNRSEIACNILAENGFTKVYNIIGGIEAWIQASLPIYNTAHKVTIENGGIPHITIDRLPLPGCTTCGQGSGSTETIQNLDVTTVEQNETYTEAQVTFDFNGTTFDNVVFQNTLWAYTRNDAEFNVTARFLSENSVGDIATQFYLLNYEIQHATYNFSVTTKLTPLDTDTYNSSGTLVRFFPVGKPELLSMELVNFTSPVTLSGLYRSLEQACKKLARTYQRDGKKYNDDTLKGIADSYSKMAKGLQSLSKLVRKELRGYNREILQNIAVLTDDACSDCQYWCELLIGYVTCTVYDVLLGVLVCGSLGATTGILGIVCAVIWSFIVGAICIVGVPPYCSNLCQYGGYCTPQTFYVNSIHSTTEYGDGEVTNEYNLIGIADDDAVAHIEGSGNGDGGNIWCIMNAPSHGEVKVRTVSIYPVNTYLHVYIIHPNTGQWVLLNYVLVTPAPGFFVISFGSCNANFDQLAVAAYNAQGPSNIVIDNVKVVN